VVRAALMRGLALIGQRLAARLWDKYVAAPPWLTLQNPLRVDGQFSTDRAATWASLYGARMKAGAAWHERRIPRREAANAIDAEAGEGSL